MVVTLSDNLFQPIIVFGHSLIQQGHQALGVVVKMAAKDPMFVSGVPLAARIYPHPWLEQKACQFLSDLQGLFVPGQLIVLQQSTKASHLITFSSALQPLLIRCWLVGWHVGDRKICAMKHKMPFPIRRDTTLHRIVGPVFNLNGNIRKPLQSKSTHSSQAGFPSRA